MSARLAGFVRTSLLALSLAACGGGGGSSSGTAQPMSASVSSGAITAFGSVFVNGHEFGTSHATVIDDDSGAASTTASLEVGMVVTVKPASGSTDTAPEAAEIHMTPLARGYVAASDSSAGTISVMGQTVQISSATVFSDRRACVSAATPCTPVSGQSGLAVGATGSGSFVGVHGYLFASGSGGAQIVATLINVRDPGPDFKLEGVVTALDATAPSVTIGTETVDLSHASCRTDSASAACASAFKVGDVVAAHGTTLPSGSTFTPAFARSARLLPQTPGATVEVEGKVSSVNGSSFVVRGVQVDGSALPSDQLPAVGDRIELVGTIAADGLTVTAASVEGHEHAIANHLVMAGPLTSVTPGIAANTFNVVVLGQTAVVSADTRIADRTSDTQATFNITNFQTYLQGKSSPYVVVRTVVDGTGALQARGFDIVKTPSSGLVGIAGTADAAEVVSGGSASVMVHGVSVIFDPLRAIAAKGNLVLAKGALTSAGAIDTTVSKGRILVLPFGEHDHDIDIGLDDD
jgi:hypothetical protein